MFVFSLAVDSRVNALQCAFKRPIHNCGECASCGSLERIGDREGDSALVAELRKPPERRIGVDDCVCGAARNCKGQRTLLYTAVERRLHGKRDVPGDASRSGVFRISPRYFRRFAAAGFAGFTAGFSFTASGFWAGAASFRRDGTPVMIPSYSVSAGPTVTPF